MPSSTEAALVALIVIVPGFLAMAGYRAGRAVPAHSDGLVASARVITASVVIVLVAWKLGGRELYENARAGTALTDDEQHTYGFAIAMLAAPPIGGFLLAELVDAIGRGVARARERLEASPTARGMWLRRAVRRSLSMISDRIMREGPTTWDRAWAGISREHPWVYVRVRTKSGEEIVGAVGNGSEIGTSPHPRDVHLEQVLRQGPDGRLYPTAFGLGAFVSGSDIETVEWVSHEATQRV